MAYKVSQEVISLFKSCYRQIAKIQVLGIEGLDEIKESDIVQGGLTVDRYCFSSNSLEIGTAIASELSLELKNDKGQFDSFSFDGVKLVARVGIKKWDAKTWENAIIHYVPLGVFTVDEPIKNKATVTLNALDNMVKFDRPYDTDLMFPATLGEIAEDACSKCGVLLKTTSFYNSDYVVSSRPTDEELTYRQVIQWVAQLSCTNAFVDWDGQLRFAWFEDSGITIPPSDRYDSDLEENSVLITGVKVITTDDSEHTAGSDDCIFVIEGNSLAQSNPELIASTIFARLENFSYRPYSCECRPMPYLFPMDMITFIDTMGNEHKTIVSAVTYSMNGSTDILGEGDGQTKGGYASTGTLTQHERVIIEKAKKAAEKTSTEQFNIALALNETIGSAFGLYRTRVEENGVSIWYYHDRPTLSDSTIIYIFNSGGFAWTDDWNEGNPIWQYGFTKDGNALYKILSAYKIQAEYIDSNAITADKIAAGVITADKIKANAIAGFIIDEKHIGIDKTSYDDTEHDGVYISTNGIGLGKGKFYVTSQGFLHAENGEFTGKIITNSATITGGSIVLGDSNTPDSVLINDWGIHVGDSTFAFVKATWTGIEVGYDQWVSGTPVILDLGAYGGYDTFVSQFGMLARLDPKMDNTFSISAENVQDYTHYVPASLQLVLGSTSTNGYGELWGTWKGSFASSSDRNLKHSIENLSEKYDTFFDKLIPRRFKFNDGTSDRYHTGFIAQEVENAIIDANLSTQEAALFVQFSKYNKLNEEDEITYALRYTEFIAILTSQVQKLKQKIAELESKI